MLSGQPCSCLDCADFDGLTRGMNSIPQSWISLPPPPLALKYDEALVWWEGRVLVHPELPQPSIHPPTNGKTKRKRSLHSCTWPGKRRRLATSHLDISCILGLLRALPNPLSSLKHPQGSSALHAEPCKAKNSQGHSLHPHPMSEDAQRHRCPS